MMLNIIDKQKPVSKLALALVHSTAVFKYILKISLVFSYFCSLWISFFVSNDITIFSLIVKEISWVEFRVVGEAFSVCVMLFLIIFVCFVSDDDANPLK